MRIDNETLITSSGVIKNRSKPRVGVVDVSSLYDDLFQDCLNEGIDLTYEWNREDALEQIRAENPGLDDSEIDDLVNEAMDMVEFDSRLFLLGAWVKDNKGEYVIDKSGKSGSYALQYDTENGIVCVEWSVITKECNNTSPCYVMSDGSGPCGDLNTEGSNVIAYTLPLEMFRSNDE